MKRSEFAFIGDIASMFGSLPHHGFEPIGDDCTVISMGTDALVMTTDMLVEDVHFLRAASTAEEVGTKSLLVNISDVAAMGATPIATLLSLSLPESAQGEWSEAFMRGYHAACHEYGIALVGGDTTASRDRITINVVAIGRAPMANIKRRSAAKVGDIIAVTGRLGVSSKGLVDIMFGDLTTEAAKIHRRGNARVAEGAWLGTQSAVHAMMDISDGIASDIRHIMELSDVGADIELSAIPTDYDIRYATTGGEDYELLLTVDPANFDAIATALKASTGTTLTAIGRITATGGLRWLQDGTPTDLDLNGFTHF
ncbi:MAG: thiamine-phosphate kinase [Rikenellaceae bacterium]|nr:thiamine-phosphate kinase [Rikenellaceae bacterium]